MFPFFNKAPVPVEVRVLDNDYPLVYFNAFLKNNCVMRMQCVVSEDSVLIGDILPYPEKSKRYINKGYGSKLMEELLRYSKNKGVKAITGNLSLVDLDHKDRLHHFYEKFGFAITEFDSFKGNYYGEIYKRIEVQQ